MSLKNGVITKPIKMTDIYNCLGIGPTHSGFDLGYANSNEHKKLNIYSYCKPVNNSNDGEIAFTDEIYKNSIILKEYTVGNPLPVNMIPTYIPPQGNELSPYRMSDWNNYNHNEFTFNYDLSEIPNIFIDKKGGYFFDVDYQYNDRNMNALFTNKFCIDILYVFQKQGAETIYWIEKNREAYDGNGNIQPIPKVTLGINFENINTLKFFYYKNIQTYNCTIIPFLRNKEVAAYTGEVKPTDNKTFKLPPQWQNNKTIANTTIGNPIGRSDIKLEYRLTYVGGENWVKPKNNQFQIIYDIYAVDTGELLYSSSSSGSIAIEQSGNKHIYKILLEPYDKSRLMGYTDKEIFVQMHFPITYAIQPNTRPPKEVRVSPLNPTGGGYNTYLSTDEFGYYVWNSYYTLVNGTNIIYMAADGYPKPEPPIVPVDPPDIK